MSPKKTSRLRQDFTRLRTNFDEVTNRIAFACLTVILISASIIVISLFAKLVLPDIMVFAAKIGESIVKGDDSPLKPTLDKLLGAFIMALFGISLFLFKKWQQYWYGVVEAGVALFGCYKFLADYEHDKATALAGFAAIYLVVRGLDNIDKGWYAKEFFLRQQLRKFVREWIWEPEETKVEQSNESESFTT